MGQIVTIELAHKLISEQCPQWANDPLVQLESAGTDHVLFRLGEDRLLRLPVADWAYDQAAKEYQWLSRLGRLPLQLSAPLFLGHPGQNYPIHWSIVQWIEGQTASHDAISDWDSASEAIAHFLQVLWQVDAANGPVAGDHNGYRGSHLSRRDKAVHQALDQLRHDIPVDALVAQWRQALDATPDALPHKWLHGDLHIGNLIARDGKLVGVIDWGLMGIGDPAVDLMVAWTWLPTSHREMFKHQMDCDEAIWMRARGWAISVAVIALAYYRGSHGPMERIAADTLQALADEEL